MRLFKNIWKVVRQLSGDDAYERYLQHYAKHHQNNVEGEVVPPLTKAKFFKVWQDKKWNGIKRCC